MPKSAHVSVCRGPNKFRRRPAGRHRAQGRGAVQNRCRLFYPPRATRLASSRQDHTHATHSGTHHAGGRNNAAMTSQTGIKGTCSECKTILVDTRDDRGLPIEFHYYFDRSKCPEEALTGKIIEPGVSATYMNPEDHPGGFRWPRKYRVFVPCSVVEAFEKRYAVQPSALGLSKKDRTGKTNSVRSSDLKIEIIHEMYEYFFVQRKLERVTMRMINPVSASSGHLLRSK